LLAAEDFLERIIPYLQSAGVLGSEVTAADREILAQAAPLIQERIVVLSEAPDLLEFLFQDASDIVVAEDAKAGLPANAGEIATAALNALTDIDDAEFKTEAIQNALQAALIDGLELKPRIAFGPIRTAISGRRISPPLFESMEILGKQQSLARLRNFAAAH
jgi:glutamyl-tRNA synthetase